MEEVRTQARLVDFSPSRFPGGGLSTIVPRAEIADAVERREYPARLVLDVDRIEPAAGDGVTGHAQVTVEWDEATLEELLQSTDDDDVSLWFDPLELATAIEESEVEAHGLRERVAVVAVTVAAAGATAGAGLAAPSTAPAGRAVIPDLPRSTTSLPTAGHAVIPDLPAGQTLGPAEGGGTREPAAAPGEPAVSAGGETTALPTIGRAVIPDLPAGMTLEPPSANVQSSGDAISFPSPSEAAGIAAGVSLLITAAGFAMVRSRTRPSRPA
jgi:hypothetical protein